MPPKFSVCFYPHMDLTELDLRELRAIEKTLLPVIDICLICLDYGIRADIYDGEGLRYMVNARGDYESVDP